LPNAKIVTGPLAAGCAGEGPYDVILLQGAAEVSRGAVRSAQKRRPPHLRARARPQGKAMFYRRAKPISAAVRCSTPRLPRCRVSPSRRNSYFSCFVFRAFFWF
jgi:hypothetical protein